LYLFAHPSFTDLIGHEKNRALSTVDGDGEFQGAPGNRRASSDSVCASPATLSSPGNLGPDQKITVTENSS
jgi:hypothetical protein